MKQLSILAVRSCVAAALAVLLVLGGGCTTQNTGPHPGPPQQVDGKDNTGRRPRRRLGIEGKDNTGPHPHDNTSASHS